MATDDKKPEDQPTQDAPPADAPAVAPTPVRKRGRGCLFRLLAVSFPLIVLAIIEGVLTLAGAGPNLELVDTVDSGSDSFNTEIREEAELVYFDRHGLAGPEPFRFQLPKPDDTYRIVVVGASTVQGFPYAGGLAFPRQLERMLNHQLGSDRVEVINLGVTALNSFSIADMADRCLVCEPDLMVVYSGHNEFYGPGGVASNAVPIPPSLYQLGLATRRTRTWQVFANLISPPEPSSDSPLDSLPANLDLPMSSSEFTSAGQYYEANLSRIADTCDTANVPLILCTVTSNLCDHSPTSQLTPYPPGEEDGAWMKHFNEGRQLASTEDQAAALASLEAAEAINAESSLLHYRKGGCLKKLGRLQEAVAAYSRARDIDGCRFRAPSTFADIVRDVSEQRDNAILCDIEQTLRTSAEPLPGHDLFLEHVHPNLKGHRFIATQLAKTILPKFLNSTWNEELNWSDEQWRDTVGILSVDELAALSLALEVMESATMKQTFDVDIHKADLMQRFVAGFQNCPVEFQENFIDIKTYQMAEDLLFYLAESDWPEGSTAELQILNAAVKRSPWSADAHRRYAAALEARGQAEAAATQNAAATELDGQ